MDIKIKTRYYVLFLSFLAVNSLVFAGGEDYLEVKGNIQADTLSFNKSIADPGGLPSTPVKGEISYDFSASGQTAKKPCYYDGTKWKLFGGAATDKTVATKIVAPQGYPDQYKADINCDGSKPDNEFIQDAITLLPPAGGVVYLLEGIYNISAAINIDKSNVSLIGAGKGTVLKLINGASNVNVINASGFNRINIAKLCLDGNGRTGSSNIGINFFNVGYSKIKEVWVENFSSYGIYLSDSAELTKNIISNCIIRNNYYGIYLSANQAAFVSSPKYNSITNNQIIENAEDGIVLYRCTDNIITGNNVLRNRRVSDGGGNGIRLVTSNYNIISSNVIDANYGSGVKLENAGCDYNLISANSITANGRSGIEFSYVAYNNSVIDNFIISSISSTGYDVKIQGSNNSISGNYICTRERPNDAIHVDSDSGKGDYNLIASNYITRIGAGTGYRINIADANCNDNYIVANYIFPFVDNVYKINDLGTDTRYTDKSKITLEKEVIDPAENPVQLNLNNIVQGSAPPYSIGPRTHTNYLSLMPNQSQIDISSFERGYTPGDILIVENGKAGTTVKFDVPSTYTYAATNCNQTAARYLGKNDILMFIWNGTKWLEISYIDNDSSN